MILCIGSSDKIQVTPTTTGQLDCHVSGVDTDNAVTPVITMYRKNTAVAAAATTDISTAPSTAHVLNIKTINITCKATTPVPFSVSHNDGATAVTLWSGALYLNQTLVYVEGVGWNIIPATAGLRNESTASVVNTGTDVYMTGSSLIFPSAPAIGTVYQLRFDITKTAAGTAGPIVTIRIGANGTTADTARLTFTYGVGTAAIDAGVLTCEAMFRSVGAGTSAVLVGRAQLVCTQIAGGIVTAARALSVVGTGFDSSALAGQIIGASYNGGSSASHTIQLVTAELIP